MSSQPPLSTGEQLRLARESRKLSLEQAAYQTHIRQRYLTALETDDLSQFPSLAQARGFLRTYAGHLNLDAEALINLLDGKSVSAEAAPPPASAPAEAPIANEEEPEPPPVAAGDASFIVIGQKLRAQRELLGLSIEDVERHSHVRTHYLQALEAGRIDDLPSPVQGRGMLTNYAAFLGLDPDPLLMRYADGLQARLSFRQRLARPVKAARPVAPPGTPRPRLPLDLIFGGGLALALIAFIVWGAVRISQIVSQVTPEATGPSIAVVLSGEDTPTPTATLSASGVVTATQATATLAAPLQDVNSTPTPADVMPTLGNAPVQVYIVALGRSWLRVSVDGAVEFEGRTLPGSNYPYTANESIIIKAGNGAALKVVYNRTDLGVLGGWGEVVERVFTVSGIQLPTPTITPTPPPATATPPTTPTPAITPIP